MTQKKGKSEEIKVTAAMIDAGVTAFDEAKGAFTDYLVVVRVYRAMRALEASSAPYLPIGTGGPCYSSRGREPDAVCGSEVGLRIGAHDLCR
jgi:hypothetical protein